MTFSARFLLASFLAMGSLMATGGEARADVYMVKDARGVVYFTNEKPSKGQDTILKRYTFSNSSPASTRPTSSGVRVAAVTPVSLRGSSNLETIISDAALRYRLDPALIKAVIRVESAFNRYSVSGKGAKGLMQLMPDTAREMGVSRLFDPEENIEGGSRYLRKMLDRFDGNLRLALAAYNAGPNAVARYGGVPPFDETRRYVRKVWNAYGDYRGGKLSMPGETMANYYTYVGDGGAPVYTDQPRGRQIFLTD